MPEMKLIESGNLLTPQQAADYLNIKLSTIYSMSMKKTVPVCKVGKLLRFRRQDLDKWIAEHIQEAV